jgi:hypothetical protein
MKILYGVPSEGMGHATRSKVVIAYLLSKGHDVRVVTSDRAFSFLQTHFGERVISIEGFHLAYNNARVSVGQTILLSLKNIPKQILKNFTAYQTLLKDFMPDLVISDFESFSHFFAKTKNIPFVSIDNMQVLNRAKLDILIPKEERGNQVLSKNIVKAKVPGALHYYITSFFHPALRKEQTSYVAPIIREEIIQTKPSVKDHIVVYQTSTSQKDLIPVLQSITNQPFIVYGFNRDEEHGNVLLKSFSEKEFIQNVASAKAVIANGGFSFISEAVFLKKPVCCVPIKNQFEQFVNAAYIQKLQYGRHFDEFTTDQIKAFLYDLPVFQQSLQAFSHDGNKALFSALDKLCGSK